MGRIVRRGVASCGMRLLRPIVLFCSALPLAHAADTAIVPSAAFDGRWFIALTCDDVKEPSGRITKGYTFQFYATVAEGRLEGRYGTPGTPSSVLYTGVVGEDGAVEIRATGNTGKSDYTVGSVSQGTAYSYTLTGRVDAAKGLVERRELRPCRASLVKQ